MKRYFFKNFILIFSITVLILLIQSAALIFQYSDSNEDWKSRVYVDFVDAVADELTNTSYDSSGQSLINFISGFEDDRVCGIVVTDSSGRMLLSAGNSSNGKPFGQMQQPSTVSTKCLNTVISLTTEGNSVTIEIGDSVERETSFYGPANAEIQDVVGSVTVTKDLSVLFNVYLLTYSPITYEYSKDILRSCINSLIFSVAISLVIAFFAAWIISKTNTKRINSIRTALNSLADGKENVEVSHYRDKEFNQIPVAIENLDNSLQANRKSQKAWLMSISHDLNTPLTAIKMLVDGMQEGMIQTTDDVLKDLQSQTDILDGRVKKVIDYSTLQSATKINVSEFATEILLSKYENINHYIECRNLNGDLNLIQKACDELVSNALATGCDKKEILISIKENENDYVIEVTNDGTLPQGIKPEDLFKAWTKGDFARNSKSNGLGLPIVGTIAELHNGSATIKQISQTKVCASLVWPKKRG